MSRNEAYQHRLARRDSLLEKGINPYPQDGHRTHSVADALGEAHGNQVEVAGRVVAIRTSGKISFIDVEDESGKVQLVVRASQVENYEHLKDFANSDFMRVRGSRMATKAGEESIQADEFEMLAKALRPLPDKRVGLENPEMRYRLRSVDLASNPEVREVFVKRSAIIHTVRNTLVESGFMEVETPTIQPLYGGANARPFMTHIHAWDLDLYLRISPELYLKHLIMGGLERVFEITKNFRNEGVDRSHNPEFTMMECYSAWWDYNDMMDLTEVIYRNAAIASTGDTKVNYQGVMLDFDNPWPRIPMKQAIRDLLGLDVDQMNDDEIKTAISFHGLEFKQEWKRGLGIAKLFEACEEHLIQPTFITDMPKETTSLCKPHRDDPELIERFEPYIYGMEIGNAYTELNDPVLQRQFWEEERANQADPHPMDENFLRAMEYGMPPTGGLGLGIDRMVMLLTNQTKIRDVILFPTMKPKQ